MRQAVIGMRKIGMTERYHEIVTDKRWSSNGFGKYSRINTAQYMDNYTLFLSYDSRRILGISG